MRVYNYSEARQKLASILNIAQNEEVIISRNDGSRFKIVPITGKKTKSSFDIKGIDCDFDTNVILDVIRENRENKI